MVTGKIDLFEPTKEKKLYNILKSFGINCNSIELSEKRFFDIYSLRLTNGVRSSRIDRVLNDIGMSMASHSKPKGYPCMKDGVYKIEIQTKPIETPSFDYFLDNFPNDCGPAEPCTIEIP